MNWLEKWVSVSSRSYLFSYSMFLSILLTQIYKLFPSPLGVIFSRMRAFLSIYLFYFFVSVSSRSYLFSYTGLVDNTGLEISFRLLSELSFLVFFLIKNSMLFAQTSFRLLSELSFLVCVLFFLSISFTSLFPSPLGVIFSRILYIKIEHQVKIILMFPSPLGVIFSRIKRIFITLNL